VIVTGDSNFSYVKIQLTLKKPRSRDLVFSHGDEGILRESRSGQGSQEERLNSGTEGGYANLLGDPGALTGANAKEEETPWVIADSSDDEE
jgi:hypothetical protein